MVLYSAELEATSAKVSESAGQERSMCVCDLFVCGCLLQRQHRLTHFVAITKAYDTASPPKQCSSSKGAAKKPHLDLSTQDLVYEYPEMELFVKVQ